MWVLHLLYTYLILTISFLDWDWTPEAEEDAKKAFNKAFELGIPFYDTGNLVSAAVTDILFILFNLAEVYGDGESESEIKRFRESYAEEEKNQQIIATKFFPHPDRIQFPDVLLSALKDSLARLGMFKVDLYQIHAAIHPAEIEVVGKGLTLHRLMIGGLIFFLVSRCPSGRI